MRPYGYPYRTPSWDGALQELGRPRVKTALRDESYAWVSESRDFAKVQGSGFHRNQEKAVSREITLF